MISPVTGPIISSSNISVVSATAVPSRIKPDPTHRQSDSPLLDDRTVGKVVPFRDGDTPIAHALADVPEEFADLS